MLDVKKVDATFNHYDLYEFEGWTLREVRSKRAENRYVPGKGWTLEYVDMVMIVWGIHKPCGLRGIIMVMSAKVICQCCKQTMPTHVYNNLVDAIGLLKSTLESSD